MARTAPIPSKTEALVPVSVNEHGVDEHGAYEHRVNEHGDGTTLATVVVELPVGEPSTSTTHTRQTFTGTPPAGARAAGIPGTVAGLLPRPEQEGEAFLAEQTPSF